MNFVSVYDQSNVEDYMRELLRDETQKVSTLDNNSAESEELPPAATADDNKINDLVLPIVNNNQEGNIPQSPTLKKTIGAFEQSFSSVQEGLSSTYQSTGIPPDNRTPSPPPTNQQSSTTQVVASQNVTTTNIPLVTERHIMISYNRESSSDICKDIYDRLKYEGYDVWMDQDALHGKILNGMAQAVESSYIVLMCYNEKYSQSDFCEIEATYAFTKQIDLIPCRLQESYEPKGWLGSLALTRLYIDFAPPNNFDQSFEKLVEEIKYIKDNPQSNRYRLDFENNRLLQAYNQKKREQFDTLIREFKESIDKNDDDLQSLTKEELCQLVHHLRERLFNDNTHVQQNQTTVDRTIRTLFEQSQTQTELLERITEILSNPIDWKTMIKLALVVLFVWTVKTHIVDAYIKHK